MFWGAWSRKIPIHFLFVALIVHCLGVDARADESQPVYILVPGFFNSLVPGEKRPDGRTPYFSSDVLSVFRERGLDAIVVDWLSPVGTVEDNGAILERFLRVTSDRFPERKMVVIAHSAGGLYTMRALTLAPSLPIETVLTIATPYGGVDFVEKLGTHVPGLDALAKFLRLESLREFRPAGMQQLLSRMSLPASTHWIALAGVQQPCFLLSCGKAEKLSWILSITDKLTGRPSDGVVSVDSALALNTQVALLDGGFLAIEQWSDFDVGLEHWEMVEDSRLFKLLGVTNTGEIKRRQRRLIGEILNRLSAGRAPLSQPAL